MRFLLGSLASLLLSSTLLAAPREQTLSETSLTELSTFVFDVLNLPPNPLEQKLFQQNTLRLGPAHPHVRSLLRARARLAAAPAADRALARIALRQSLLSHLRQAASPDAQWLLCLHDSHHPPLVPAAKTHSPLYLHAARAAFDLRLFLGSPHPSREDFIRQLAAQYPALPLDSQSLLDLAPLVLATLDAHWPQIPASHRPILLRALRLRFAPSPADLQESQLHRQLARRALPTLQERLLNQAWSSFLAEMNRLGLDASR